MRCEKGRRPTVSIPFRRFSLQAVVSDQSSESAGNVTEGEVYVSRTLNRRRWNQGTYSSNGACETRGSHRPPYIRAFRPGCWHLHRRNTGARSHVPTQPRGSTFCGADRVAIFGARKDDFSVRRESRMLASLPKGNRALGVREPLPADATYAEKIQHFLGYQNIRRGSGPLGGDSVQGNARYPAGPLEAELKEQLGDALMSQALRPIAVVSCEFDSGSPEVFRGRWPRPARGGRCSYAGRCTSHVSGADVFSTICLQRCRRSKQEACRRRSGVRERPCVRWVH